MACESRRISTYDLGHGTRAYHPERRAGVEHIGDVGIFEDRHAETGSGSRAHEFGIVRIDRSGPEDDDVGARGGGRSPEGAGVARIVHAVDHHDEGGVA